MPQLDTEYKIPLGKTMFIEPGLEVRTISLGQLINGAVARRARVDAEEEFASSYSMTPAEVFRRFNVNDSARECYKNLILAIAKQKYNEIYSGLVLSSQTETRSDEIPHTINQSIV